MVRRPWGASSRGNPLQGFPHTPSCASWMILRAKTLGRCPKPRWGLNPQTPLAASRSSIYVRHKAESFAVKRRSLAGVSFADAITNIARLRPGSACQGFPHTPSCALWNDTTGKTLGRCPKPRWGLNPQTPLAASRSSIYVRHKAESFAVKRRSLAGVSFADAITNIARLRPGSACQGFPHTPSCALWNDTTGKTLGRCPKPRWGLNPQTPLAASRSRFYVRHKAESFAVKRCSLAGD